MWEELERRLEGRIAEMQEQGDDWIPSVHVQDILNGCVHPRVVERLKVVQRWSASACAASCTRVRMRVPCGLC